MNISDEMIGGARNIVFGLGSLAKGEKVCVVSDTTTKDIGDLLAKLARDGGAEVEHRTVAPYPIHGTEPPDDVAAVMLGSDLVLGITEKSMAHTNARVRACDRGARYLSLPEYSFELLAHEALRIDFKECARRAREIADVLNGAREIRVVSPGGTDIVLSATDRVANFCPGYVDRDHRLGSPPDIESNVSPIEDASNGVAVIDGSIAYPGFGRLATPVTLTVERGRIAKMAGEKDTIAALEELFSRYPDNAKVLAEFGIGFNPAAKLCGNMLMDEGCYGTFHFGFGSNATVGGKNSVPFHLDFVFYASEFFADGRKIQTGAPPRR